MNAESLRLKGKKLHEVFCIPLCVRCAFVGQCIILIQPLTISIRLSGDRKGLINSFNEITFLPFYLL